VEAKPLRQASKNWTIFWTFYLELSIFSSGNLNGSIHNGGDVMNNSIILTCDICGYQHKSAYVIQLYLDGFKRCRICHNRKFHAKPYVTPEENGSEVYEKKWAELKKEEKELADWEK
jgi:hypothetical protein